MGKKVLILGDTIIDKNIELKAIGLSLESPTIKTIFIDENINYGGAANTARYAMFFGLNITFVSYMTKNSEIDFVSKSKLKFINLDNKIENVKTRFYINHGNEKYKYLQINDIKRNKQNYVSGADLILTTDYMNEFDIVAFSDYRCDTITKKMISNAHDSNAQTYAASQVSSHTSNFEKYQNMDFIVCNKLEASKFSRRNNVIMTKGAAGCELNGVQHCSPFVSKPENIIGAGDVFYAAFLAYGDVTIANEKAAAYVRGDISC